MKTYLSHVLIFLSLFCQSCVEGNTQVQDDNSQDASKGDSIFLAGIPQGKLTNPLLEEVSGLVVSSQYPNRMYVQTDSGGEAVVYALDTLGNELGKIALAGLSNRDWEDLAIGPGPNGTHYIYLADIGDNDAKYPEVYLYRFLEPAGFQEIVSQDIQAAKLNYQGGPRDAETFLVDPISGELFIISKREQKNALFRVPADAFEKGEALLEKSQEFNFTSSVGGDISKDGRQIIIKNYLEVFYWTRLPNQSISEALQSLPRRLPYQPEPQGEAIGFNLKGDAYFTISEKRNGIVPTLYRYPKK